ncbi:lipoprotein [Streptomyces sp. NPDC088915]|uniref:LptM family lipoprotein n=1 Tax=Streptomyces sp. NPDC088915 TaxID=3365912 RepID=UPI003812F02B
MKRTVSVLTMLFALVALTGCDRFEPRGGKPLDPMPAHVPTTPQYTTPDEVVAALARAGMPCKVLRRRTGALDCEARISGTTVENRIQVLNPEEFSRDEVGDSIAAWRNSGTTLVAAGNWFIRVLPNDTPAYSIKVANAIDAVVLPPPYPLPDIPSTPVYATADALADALDKTDFCMDRERRSTRELLCGSRSPEKKSCDASWANHHALLLLHKDPAARDDYIRLLLSNDHTPAVIVTAANWTIQFCDSATARAKADALGGVLIHHNPTA